MERKIALNLNLNGLLVTHQIDKTSPVGCARRRIRPWLSQGLCTRNVDGDLSHGTLHV